MPNNNSVSCWLLFVLSLLLAGVTVVVWYFGFACYARETLPFVCGFSLLVLIISSFLASRSRQLPEPHPPGPIICPAFDCVCKYGKSVFFTSLLTTVITLIAMATLFTSATAVIILAAVGSVFFWFMVLSFAAIINCMINRRFPI